MLIVAPATLGLLGVTAAPAAATQYQCTLDSSSVSQGPILLTNWTINKVS